MDRQVGSRAEIRLLSIDEQEVTRETLYRMAGLPKRGQTESLQTRADLQFGVRSVHTGIPLPEPAVKIAIIRIHLSPDATTISRPDAFRCPTKLGIEDSLVSTEVSRPCAWYEPALRAGNACHTTHTTASLLQT